MARLLAPSVWMTLWWLSYSGASHRVFAWPMEHDTQATSLSVRGTAESILNDSGSCFRLFLGSLSLPSVSREALREFIGGQRLHLFCCQYVQLPLPSDSPPPLAAAAGLDPAVVGRFKNFCHSKPIVELRAP